LTVVEQAGMSQGRRAPQQHHLNMRVKPEPGLVIQPTGTQPSTNGKAAHQPNGIEGTNSQEEGWLGCVRVQLSL
jgi:hypothetical protein